MKKHFTLIVLFLTFCFANAFATNRAVNWTSIKTSPSCAGAVATYTLSATNFNAAASDAIAIGSLVTITFPAGTDATNCTTGTYFATAIGAITHVSTTQITFSSPIAVPRNQVFTVVLNNVTNPPAAVYNTLTMTAPNSSGAPNTTTFSGGAGASYTINPETITTGPVATPLCKGATVNIPYTIGICPFFGGNTFTAQLSDAAGSFAAPITIGTLSATGSGTIVATIPAGTATGTGYLIRVIGSNPSITGTTNSNGNITISTPMTYASSAVTQFSTNVDPNCALTNAILEIQVVVTGSCTPLSITQFNFNTAGSTNPSLDISKAKVYYTAQTQGFTTSKQFGAEVPAPNGAFAINGSQELSFGAGTYYFYLTYDVPSTATVGDVVDASMTSFVIGGSTKSDMTTPNPAGSRTIVAGSSCTYTITRFPDLNFCGSVYTTAADQTINFTLNESTGTRNEFGASQANKTIVLTLPPGFAFDLAAAPVPTLTTYTLNPVTEVATASTNGNITAKSFSLTATAITVTLTTNGATSITDALSFQGFKIYPTGPGSGDLLRTAGTFSVQGTTGNPTSSQSFGHMISGPSMVYSSSAVNQYTTASIDKNCTNSTNGILEIQVNVTNPCEPLTVTQFDFNTAGSTNPADITEAEIYYSGQTQGLSYDSWFGLTPSPNGAFMITGSQTLTLGAGTYYFYLVYDVPAGATVGDALDASMTSFVIDGVTETDMSTPNPAGSRTIATGVCPLTPDVLNPPANNQTVTAGSLVIPMDNAKQNLYINYPFNVKAYGLVHSLLMNDIPVKWVIKSGKAKDAADFVANASRVYPTAVAAATYTFVASEFIVDSTYVNKPFHPGGKTATQVITAFEAAPPRAAMVAVYKLTADVVVDVRYTLTARPKIAVFSNGGHEGIQSAMLDSARITNYFVENAGDFGGLAACYTFCSEAHWQYNTPPGDPITSNLAPVQNIVDFVNEGGNFLAMCAGIDLYENHQPKGGHFQTTEGIIPGNNTITNTSYNPDMAYNQYQGIVYQKSGLIASFWPAASSVYKPEMYYGVSKPTATDTVVATGSHLADPDSIGSNVFYLGGHNYGAGGDAPVNTPTVNTPNTDVTLINGCRMYLNATLVPAKRPTAFLADTGPNRTICTGQSTTLGGNPTGPAGAFYTWTPSTGLNNPNSANPIASPTVTTTYIVYVNNDGCPGSGQVTITVINANPAANAGNDTTVCANSNVSLRGSVTNATGGTWTTNGTGTFSPNANTLITTYTPSNADVTAGTVTFTLTSTGNIANCNSATDKMVVTITPIPAPIASVGAVKSTTVCAKFPTISISGTATNGTGVWSTTGTGTFSPNATIAATSYSMSTADTASPHFVKLYFTVSGSGCSTSKAVDSLMITITPEPRSKVGVAGVHTMTVCANSPLVAISGTASNGIGIWSTSGTGTFSPDSTIAATGYSLSAADTASPHFVKLYLSVTGNTGCSSSTAVDSLMITITPVPQATVGVGGVHSLTVCANSPLVAISGTAANGTGIWSTSGTGTFSPDSTIAATGYSMSAADTAAPHFVKLYLTVTGNTGCGSSTAIDSLMITITPKPIASVGVSKSITVCANDSVSISGTATNGTGIWSTSGSGRFSPDSTIAATHYSLSVADTAAPHFVKLYLSVSGCSSSTAVDSLMITITPVPRATAVSGAHSMTVCAHSPLVAISGTATNGTGIWSTSGTGTFSPDSTTSAIGYSMSTVDTAAPHFVKLYLTVTGNSGCSISTAVDSLMITVSPEPRASVGAIKSTGVCANVFDVAILGTVIHATGIWSTDGTGIFTPNDSIDATKYTLSNADTAARLVHLILSATGFGGCSTYTDTDTLTITTSSPPYVSVGVSHSISVCTNNANVTLNGKVGGAIGGVWTSSGTGTFNPSDTALNTVYIPSSLDTAQSSIKLFLKSTGNGACNYVIDSMVVTMLDPPTVNFSNTSVCKNNVTAFTSNSTAITSITSWSWNFGDSNTGTGPNPTHLYANDGNYPVTLTVTDANTCTSTFTKPVIVYPLPIAAFNSTAQCFKGSVNFTDKSTVSSGSISTRNWSFGDTGSSNLQNPSHLYSVPNTYIGTLIVASNFGCLDTVSQSLNVTPPPKADIISDSVCLNSATQFSDLSTIDPLAGNIISRKLLYGDNTPSQDITNNPTPSHTYKTSGTFNDTLIVVASNGCSDTLIQPVIVYPLPLAAYNIASACIADSTIFTDTSSISSGSITGWLWDFGNGSHSNSKKIAHKFAATGSYPVSLIVTSDKGCKDTVLKPITISPSPTASFTANPSIVELHTPIQFTDNSVGANFWNWNFGDTSGTSVLQNPSYAYNQRGGTYNVSLQITNTFGCKDTVSNKIIVTMPPKVANAFSPNGDGKNDILHVMGGPYKTMEFKILDNWGEYIFVSNNQSTGWDGTKNGVDQPMGVYVYTLTVTTEDNAKYVMHGDITLLR